MIMGLGRPIHQFGGSILEILGAAVCCAVPTTTASRKLAQTATIFQRRKGRRSRGHLHPATPKTVVRREPRRLRSTIVFFAACRATVNVRIRSTLRLRK